MFCFLNMHNILRLFQNVYICFPNFFVSTILPHLRPHHYHFSYILSLNFKSFWPWHTLCLLQVSLKCSSFFNLFPQKNLILHLQLYLIGRRQRFFSTAIYHLRTQNTFIYASVFFNADSTITFQLSPPILVICVHTNSIHTYKC